MRLEAVSVPHRKFCHIHQFDLPRERVSMHSALWKSSWVITIHALSIYTKVTNLFVLCCPIHFHSSICASTGYNYNVNRIPHRRISISSYAETGTNLTSSCCMCPTLNRIACFPKDLDSMIESLCVVPLISQLHLLFFATNNSCCWRDSIIRNAWHMDKSIIGSSVLKHSLRRYVGQFMHNSSPHKRTAESAPLSFIWDMHE
jgi:hypothetical protein